MKNNYLLNLAVYFRKPEFSQEPFKKIKMNEWLAWICVCLTLELSAVLIGLYILHLSGYKVPSDKWITNINHHPSMAYGALIVLAPILEEIYFRLFLTRTTKIMIIGLGLFVGIIVVLFIPMKGIDSLFLIPTTDLPLHYMLANLIIIILGLSISILMFPFQENISKLLLGHKSPVIFFSLSIFALLHVYNFEDGFHLWLTVITLPQFVGGMVFVYIRVNHGLKWSIFTHSAIDIFLFATSWVIYLYSKGFHPIIMNIIDLSMGLIVLLTIIIGTVIILLNIMSLVQQRFNGSYKSHQPPV